MRIGVLALQGDVREHSRMLAEAGVEPVSVKWPRELAALAGLIIPGGESTTIGKLLRRFDLLAPLQQAVREGFPVYGTCAGMILLADRVEGAGVDQPTIGGMDLTVRRNAFGRQRESFEADLDMPAVGDRPLPAVFIRAPLIEEVGPEVEVLARLPDGRVVAARQANLLVTSFHPELTNDARLHGYFAAMCAAARDPAAV
ncbi:MAG TPA: pyridoxal 5'-phosphate synthase glutaminase subunit PdxT [Chloroflexota bacterium]|nr:pyridoxal 5'-phosphate synthase glutaminase subunit PdxT [Chloroflexota bacterium]